MYLLEGVQNTEKSTPVFNTKGSVWEGQVKNDQRRELFHVYNIMYTVYEW